MALPGHKPLQRHVRCWKNQTPGGALLRALLSAHPCCVLARLLWRLPQSSDGTDMTARRTASLC